MSSFKSDREYEVELESHYSAIWGRPGTPHLWTQGPAQPFLHQCGVFEYAPSDKTFCWVYATCGMTPLDHSSLLELFLLSPCSTESHVELLSVVAHYHQTGAPLELGHTVNFGRPWLEKSQCSFGLISLPYTFGPSLELANIAGKSTRVLWLIPITSDERSFKISSGLEALEQKFERQQFDYLDPMRGSVVEKP